MQAGLIVLFVFFAIVVTVGFLCYIQISKTSRRFTSLDKEVNTTKEVLPFIDIFNGIIDLGNFKYRIIIECSSINYHLRSQEEQNIIEMTYMRFLHNRNFPIVVYIATRKFNFSKVISNFKEQNGKTIEEFGFKKDSPIGQLANNQAMFLKLLEDSQANMQQKRKYIIVPYDLDQSEVNKLSDEEKRDFAVNQIINRANMIRDDLRGLKIDGKILKTKEVVEVFYSALNSDNSDLAEAVGNEVYNSVFVDSNDIGNFHSLSSLDIAGLTLTEAINKLCKVQEIIEKLEDIKNELF